MELVIPPRPHGVRKRPQLDVPLDVQIEDQKALARLIDDRKKAEPFLREHQEGAQK